LAEPCCALREAALYERRGRKRLGAAGADPTQEPVFTDRVVLTLVHLRTNLPYAALAELYGAGRSTVSDAIGEIRPLPGRRGFAVPGRPGLRPRTLADVLPAPRSKAHRPGCRAFARSTRPNRWPIRISSSSSSAAQPAACSHSCTRSTTSRRLRRHELPPPDVPTAAILPEPVSDQQ